MKLYLKIWRQTNADSNGSFQNYEIDEITPDMSFLEMMDVLNEKLILMPYPHICYIDTQLTMKVIFSKTLFQ